MIPAACLIGLVLVLWRLAAHLDTRPALLDARPFECWRCGRAYRNDHALAQHVGCMHPAEWDGAEVGAAMTARGGEM